MLRRFFVLVLFLSASYMGYSQGNVTFDGAARSDIRLSQLDGNLTETDTFNADQSLNGETFLDLGITFNPNSSTEIKGVTRILNEFGGFFGEGVEVRLRELYVKGVVGGKFRYQVGDFNESLTPYTFYNNGSDLFGIHSPTTFQDYQDIIDYENFYEGNTWRQQGVKVDFGLDFDQFLEGIDFKGFVSQNRASNVLISSPSTLFGGAEAIARHEKIGNIGFHWTNLFDIDETVRSVNSPSFRNPVVTGSYDLLIDATENFAVGVVGEAGFSRREYRNTVSDTVELEGSFFDVGVQGKLKNIGLDFTASFFSVDADFRSPGAQTRTVYYQDEVYNTENFSASGNESGIGKFQTTNNDPSVFPTFIDTSTTAFNRNTNIWDLTSDADIYNRFIQRDLGQIGSFDFDPHYNNTNPYGKATPNRQGVNVHVALEKENLPVAFEAHGIIAQEKSGIYSTNKREFFKFKGGVRLDVEKLYQGQKKLQLNAGGTYENTNRDAVATANFAVPQISLTNRSYEFGINWEVLKNFELLGGFRYHFSSGNEVREPRDEFTRIIEPTNVIVDNTFNYFVEELVTGGGIKYNFSDFTYVKVEYQASSLDADIAGRSNFDYDFNQLIFLFNLQF